MPSTSKDSERITSFENDSLSFEIPIPGLNEKSLLKNRSLNIINLVNEMEIDPTLRMSFILDRVKPKSSFKYPGKLKFDSKLILFSDELWAKELNWKNKYC